MHTLTSSNLTKLLLITTLAITTAIYYPGLGGDFIFDDIPNILLNAQVAITSLAPDQLYQAWNSSANQFPASRPLSMLTFGLNHAFTGFDSYWFKVTNLLIHLLCGAALFQLTRITAQLYTRINEVQLTANQINNWALATSATWLLHPLNFTPVLYIVQRMTSLSALFLLLAMLAYVYGRTRQLDGKSGIFLILLATPTLGFLAFLCKENGILLPGFLFVLEITLFRFKTQTPNEHRFLQLYFLLGLALPIAIAATYLLLYPQWLIGGYTARPFTLPERLMSEAKVLWFYLQMAFRPDNALLGLYHDDFQISHSLLKPPTTLLAVLSIIGLTALALWQRKNTPLLSFGILFFIIGHSLESTIIPLELIFEHRNYLPSAGLFIALTYYLVAAPAKQWLQYCGITIAILFVIICAANTALRTQDWKDTASMVRAEVEHHPNSPRANFQMANMLINIIRKTNHVKDKEALYPSAHHFLKQTVNLDKKAAYGLFGLVILQLYMNKQVEQHWLDKLRHRVEHIPYAPQNFTTGHFFALIRLHMSNSGKQKLPPKALLGIVDAALRNQTLNNYTRAGIHAAMTSYQLKVLNDSKAALKHGYKAVKAWPQNGQYQAALIKLLLKKGDIDKAKQQLHLAWEADKNQFYTQQIQEAKQQIQRALQAP